MRPYQRELLNLIARLPARQLLGAEVGVATGRTSALLLRQYQSLQLWMVDAWSTYTPDHEYRRSGDRCALLDVTAQEQLFQVVVDLTAFAEGRRRIVRAASQRAVHLVSDEQLDFVFLDADHTYDAVRADLSAWWVKVRPGGLFCGHDFGHARDRQGVWGVSRAVREFVGQRQLSLQSGRDTMWWIWKPENIPEDEKSSCERFEQGDGPT